MYDLLALDMMIVLLQSAAVVHVCFRYSAQTLSLLASM